MEIKCKQSLHQNKAYANNYSPKMVDYCIVYGCPLALSFLLAQLYSVPILI